MSVQQCVAWYEAAQRRLGANKLFDLQVLVAPNEQDQYDRLREHLIEMAQGTTTNG